MEKKYVSTTNRIIRSAAIYGSISGALFIGLFLVMKLFGLEKNFNLRLLNFPILFFLTYKCLISLEEVLHKHVNYLRGMLISVLVAGIGGGIFASFMFFYLTFLDKEFMIYITEHAPFGWTLAPIDTAFWVLHELLGIQVIYAFIVTEAYKFKIKARKEQHS